MNKSKILMFWTIFTFAFYIPLSANMNMYVINRRNDAVLNDGNLHIYFCGTGDPEAGMQNIRRPSCLAIIADNEFFLIDAGEGAIQNIGALGLPYDKVNRIFMTHWHSDHFAGIGQVNNIAWVGGRQTPLELYGPYGVSKMSQALNDLYYLDVLYRSIGEKNVLNPYNAEIKPHSINMQEKDPIFSTKNLMLTPFLVDHTPSVPALGYVLQYKNCKIVISGDTAIEPGLKKPYQNADLLISEAFSHSLGEEIKNSLDTDPTHAMYKMLTDYHSDTWKLAKLATAQGVKQIILTHLVPAIPTTQTVKDDFIKGMNQSFKGSIKVANDRDHVLINSENGKCMINYQPATQPDIPIQQVTK